jgi:hypothetical protein
MLRTEIITLHPGNSLKHNVGEVQRIFDLKPMVYNYHCALKNLPISL